MIFGQPFTQAGRQQKVPFRNVPTVALAHDSVELQRVPIFLEDALRRRELAIHCVLNRIDKSKDIQ